MNQYYVYILECKDNSFYVGVTNDVFKRFEEHENSITPKSYTFNRRPLKLVFYTDFQDIRDAIAFEKKLKGWSRAKKIALIEGRYEDLPNLSKKKF